MPGQFPLGRPTAASIVRGMRTFELCECLAGIGQATEEFVRIDDLDDLGTPALGERSRPGTQRSACGPKVVKRRV
jgi:hypothetical protein